MSARSSISVWLALFVLFSAAVVALNSYYRELALPCEDTKYWSGRVLDDPENDTYRANMEDASRRCRGEGK